MEATVVKTDPERMTVKAADGTIYTFAGVIKDINIPADYQNAGFALTISFYGELDPALPLQNAVISHIGVTEKQENENALLLRAIEILRGMDMKSKVGQLFFIPCPGSLAAQTAEEYRPGGYILFSKDFEGKTKEQISADIGYYQASSAIGLLIGVDEEGGTVNRVSWFPELRDEPFLSPGKLFELGGFELITEDTGEKSELLSALGINVNLAPVADLSGNPESFIYKRSFGDDAEQVSEYIRSVVSVMCDKNMGSVLKHFPGYGDNPDTHDLAAYDNRAYDVFLSNDFLPF
ncbi:MAG: glycoside hydrolase family 3 protein, partial [Clostridiales bacterium]|nr:glycoside hydrolase family 3 protein [Clostridiales bacterium]